jgi:hypothetical protein
MNPLIRLALRHGVNADCRNRTCYIFPTPAIMHFVYPYHSISTPLQCNFNVHPALGPSSRPSSASSMLISRSAPSSLKSVSWAMGLLEAEKKRCGGKHTSPELRVYTTSIDELAMRATLGHLPLLQNNNLIAVVDRSQSMRNEYTSPRLLL